MLRYVSTTVVLSVEFILATAWLPALLCAADGQPVTTEPSADANGSAVAEVQVSSGYLGKWYTEDDDETRILLLHVSVTNRHTGPITVSLANWKLIAESRDLPAISMPAELKQVSVEVGGERVGLGDVETRTLKLDPGQEDSTWLVFRNVPDGNQIPAMTLVCGVPDAGAVRVDVDETFTNRLQLRTSRVGPADAIALLTIHGTLDSINIGALAREIDQLSAMQICRVIVAFGPDAGVPDRNVVSWLRQVALQSGRNPVVNENFPAFPTDVVDFHFVSPSSRESDTESGDTIAVGRHGTDADYDWSPATRNIHQHVAEAVSSAVAPLCERLSREQLLRSVRTGDVLTRASVLQHAAERLVYGNLRLILSMTVDADATVAGAAVYALRYSGSQTAIETLLDIVRGMGDWPGQADSPTVSEERRIVAVRSLVASKYSTAHLEVMKLLTADDSFLRVQTARAVAEAPRPVWARHLAELFEDADEEQRVELLPALAAVGHPRMLTVLEECLTSDEPRLSATALDLLVARPEPAAEQLTSEWVLRHLEKSSPSTQLLSFLRRTRDHRAVPLLRKHLSEAPTDREYLLTTVLAIGDHRVIEEVAGDFKTYSRREQLLILKALADVHSELFWELTRTLIEQTKTASDRSLDGIVSLLQRDNSEQALSLLIELLTKLVEDKNRSRRHLAVVCAALASIGTPEARDALREVVHNSKTAAETARQSLTQLYQRSPAQRYVVQGVSALQSPQRNVTLAMLYLDAAVKTDPELPDARKWRANAALHIDKPSAEQLETARRDFARYVELEPDESEGHTGLALVLVRQGNVEAGIATGISFGAKSTDDSVYFYNMACVYGRAIEQLESQKNSESPEQQRLIETYRSRAVSLLQQSIDNGLDDSNLDWMQRDPDLETVRQSPAFADLVRKVLGDGISNQKNEAEEKL